MSKTDSRIYVGNLPQDIRSRDIEDIFYKYGKIKYVDLKNRKGPPFAFVEFDDARDAKDAVSSRDGYNYDGHRLRVEFQKSPRGGGGGFGRNGGRNGPPTRRSENRCIITGLPISGSWQDLKDHMREAGNVCYADVFKDGTGVVEFIRYDDMKYAVKHLDDTKFKSHEGESSYIKVKIDKGKHGRSDSYSRSRSRSLSSTRRYKRVDDNQRGSPSYSPVRRSPDSDYSDDYDRSSKRARRSYTRSRSRSRSSRSSSGSRSSSPDEHRRSSRKKKSSSSKRHKRTSRSSSRSLNGDAEPEVEKKDEPPKEEETESATATNGADTKQVDEKEAEPEVEAKEPEQQQQQEEKEKQANDKEANEDLNGE